MKFPVNKFMAGLLLAFGSAVVASTAHAALVTIACGGNDEDTAICKKHTDAWATKTGNTVKLFTPPSNSTEALALYRQIFAAKAADLDIVMVDIVWPGVLKDHLVDLKKYSKGAEKEHFPSIVANNTIGGKLLGMPLFTDAGLLFYRKDLLEKYKVKAPSSWEDLSASAKTVQDGERAAGNADFQGFVFQAKAYEGLACNAVEWIASYGGGSIVDSAGKVTINNPSAIKAINTAASWIGTIAPAGVLNYGEEEARGVFQSGNALYLRNWPYAWSLAQGADSPIKDKVGVLPLPKGGANGKNSATLGGWQLSVSKYSKSVDAAADLVMYMTSEPIQKERAILRSLNPTRPALYKDKDVLAANPFMGSLFDVFSNSVARPATVTGLKYPEVSQAFWDATHEVLSKKSTAEVSFKRLEGRLAQIKRNQW
ncbi:MAG: ABC transporter substrate-binding protein [Pseudomonadota bacterium]